MDRHEKIKAPDKASFYKILLVKLEGMLAAEKDWLANLANASALLYNNLENINWAGFYIYKEDELVLGPFQGNTACTRIKLGKGVCGTAAFEKKTQLVKNVHEFPGHIACDCASNSEIVVPVILNGDVKGVLDIDSPILERFDDTDALYLEKFVEKLNKYIDWTKAC